MGKIGIWLKALRLFSLPASLGPVALCAAALAAEDRALAAGEIVLAALGLAAVHLAANLVNDYFDFKYAVDRQEDADSSRTLVDGMLSPAAIRNGALACYAAAALAAACFLALRGPVVLAFILPGLAVSFFYTAGKNALKYRALGEIAVFLAMGPLMFAGLSWALAGGWSAPVLFLSFPAGLHISMILTANNLRDRDKDRRAGVQTIATLAGAAGARAVFIVETALPYGLVALGAAVGLLPAGGLVALASLPLAARQIALSFHKTEKPGFMAGTAALQLFFLLLLSSGITAEALWL